ncbi:hypothetical protein DMC47_00780 [Nostoc sp. 3335mG]|nr:hypothetical protein DMC47_00780 [Nostoc sp. 3335mG]
MTLKRHGSKVAVPKGRTRTNCGPIWRTPRPAHAPLPIARARMRMQNTSLNASKPSHGTPGRAITSATYSTWPMSTQKPARSGQGRRPVSELLTSDEAAARLHLSTRTLRELRRNGLIRYIAITDRKILYRPEDCEDYIASRARKATECPSTSRKTRRTSTSTSSSTVVGFMARQAARQSGKR